MQHRYQNLMYLARYENGYFSILIVLFKKLWVLIHQSFGLAVFKCFLNKHSLISFAVFKIWKCNWQSIVKVYFVNKFRCCQIPTIKPKPQQWNMVFSRKCDSLHTITYVCAFVGLSVCTSESKTPEDLRNQSFNLIPILTTTLITTITTTLMNRAIGVS